MTGVVIGSGLVISPGVDGIDGNSPIIGYRNAAVDGTVEATSEDPDFPATNLSNPSTALRWQALDGSPITDQYVMVTPVEPQLFDYVAIARHNFGSGLFAVSVEGIVEAPGSPDAWFELVSERILPDDGPVIFRFTKQMLYAVRLRIQPSQTSPAPLPFLAVIYAGELLAVQRRIYVGHTPQKYGRQINTANHFSIAGAFLGRIILGKTTRSKVDLQNLTPDWYRTYMEPFLLDAIDNPFFFAWRPGDYPNEAGYVTLTEFPQMQNQSPNGMVQITLEMEGVS